MNISLLRILSILLLFPIAVQAQTVENYDVIVNDSIELVYNSPIFPVQIITPPTNGTYSLNGVEGATTAFGEVTLKYKPNLDYSGPDQMVLQLGNDNPIAPQLYDLFINFNVVSSIVKANDDYFIFAADQDVVIDVMANDFGSGTIEMEMVSLSNNCKALKYGDNVLLKLDNDFEGVGKFSYTICDNDMTCDQAVVTVFAEVADNTLNSVSLATKKQENKKVMLPLANGHTVTQAPSSGSLTNFSDGSFDYVPNQGFVGVDNFEVAYNTNGVPSITTFTMTVLDWPDPNNFAKDDKGHVSIGGMVDVDVLENDLGSTLYLVSIPQNGANGVATISSGEVHYEPDPGYEGLEHIKYKVCTPTFTCEIADLFINVSNDQPDDVRYFLTCVENTSLIIDYPADIPDWHFNLLDVTSDKGGDVTYHPGNWTGTVNGQTVSGYNLIVYTPPTDFTGYDVFQVEYCVDSECNTVSIRPEVINGPNISQNEYCVTDCVWPGDANKDGVVNMNDLLPIGFCTGEVGPERIGASFQWFGQHAEDWAYNGMEGPNEKHVDVDGDGHIMAPDTQAVSYNFGEYNQPTPVANVNLVDLPLYFINQTPNPQPGDLVEIDVLLGSSTNPAIDISGLSFEVNYNTLVVKEGTFNITFIENSWLAYDTPVMDMVKEPNEGEVHAGFTRISGSTATGWGKIAKVEFIIEDLIDGNKIPENTTAELVAVNTTGMVGNGVYQTYNSIPLAININYENTLGFELDPADLILYPNPTKDILNVHINNRNNFKRIDLVDISGKLLYQQKHTDNHLVLNTSILKEGIYFIRAITDKGVLTKKFEVFFDK